MDVAAKSVDQELVDIYQEINEAIDSELPEEEVAEEAQEDSNNETENNKVETSETEEIAEEDKDDEAAEYVSDEPSDEDKARDKGWRPKEEFSGNEKDWVDAPEFNRRTDLFEKIGTQNKTIKSLSKKVEALVNHVQSVESKTRDKVVAELKAKQKQAVEYGDTEAYEQAEQALEEATKQEEISIEEEAAPTEPPEVPQFLRDFATKNAWFEKDKEMTDYMVYQTQQIVSSEGKSLPEALVIAEKSVKSTFSHKFKNPNKSKPATVMSGSNEARPAKASMSRLTSEQKTVWHALKGTMTEQEFLNQLEELG